jgi:hypothetical protein
MAAAAEQAVIAVVEEMVAHHLLRVAAVVVGVVSEAVPLSLVVAVVAVQVFLLDKVLMVPQVLVLEVVAAVDQEAKMEAPVVL